MASMRYGPRTRRRLSSRWPAKDVHVHTDEPPCMSRTAKGKDRHSSSISARLSRVEKSLASLVGAVLGRPSGLDAWVHDVKERLDRMELLLFSCSFEQFTEIDEMLNTLRKEPLSDSIAWSSTQDADIELSRSSSKASLYAGMLCAPAASSSGENTSLGTSSGMPCAPALLHGVHAAIDDSAGEDYEGIGLMGGHDIVDKATWSVDNQDIGASSWSMGWPANRWDSDLFDIQLCVSDSSDGKAKGKEPICPHRSPGSNALGGDHWPFGGDLGEELSFDELIAASSSGIPRADVEGAVQEDGTGNRLRLT